MQHAHILAPPTRSAGSYLRVRQSETVYHQRIITTSIAKRKISPGTGLEPAQRTDYCGHRCCPYANQGLRI
ncbi:unnamed protein product [Acanthoscelides obtectus]|uniref:Uncharacterized protein n=1 Tax=Acanthoscelides obtectus TaxID=200917 RepID=A0A9P0Q2Z4_ACAOB|nr:unnamed protein product [Acanthoscelides obtectus]CAK1648854.1 hypothetical protein AOBTE_LOCUS15929 [Acanthoscelides obtectus]